MRLLLLFSLLLLEPVCSMAQIANSTLYNVRGVFGDEDRKAIEQILEQGVIPNGVSPTEFRERYLQATSNVFKNCPRAVGYRYEGWSILRIHSLGDYQADVRTSNHQCKKGELLCGSGLDFRFKKIDGKWTITNCSSWMS